MVRIMDRVELGKTGIRISVIGTGTWQWGDHTLWQYGKTHLEHDIQEAFQASLESGINFFDTAESYGTGASEKNLGKYLSADKNFQPQDIVIATKMFPFPWRLRKDEVIHASQASLKRLSIEKIDLFQMHYPSPPIPIETWMEGMVDAMNQGLIRAVGVSNYSLNQMSRAQNRLQQFGILLTSNQVKFNLFCRKVEKDGLFEQCLKNHITLIAYSPLAKGLLTGKYTPENRPSGLRRYMFTKEILQSIQPLLMLMKEIGEGRGNKTISQVALNWVISKGAVAIPGAKNAQQARENAGAMGWRLTPEEIKQLDLASDQLS